MDPRIKPQPESRNPQHQEREEHRRDPQQRRSSNARREQPGPTEE